MNEGLIALMLGLGAFLFVFLIIGIVFYCLMAYGLMTMAKNKGIENAWLAWIPISNYYILGQLIKTIDFGTSKFENAPMILLIGGVAILLLSRIPVLGYLLTIAFYIVLFAALYKLYKLYKPGSEVLYLVLSIIFPGIAASIIIFTLKDNEPVEVLV